MSESILRAEGVFRWFKPGDAKDDSELVAGTLVIAQNGTTTLALTGLLPDHEDDKLPRAPLLAPKPVSEERWIVGVLKNSQYVFLRRLGSDGTTYSSALSHQGFRARDCVVFRHIDFLPDLNKATKLQISLDSLGDWASEPAVEVTKTARGAKANATQPDTQTFDLPDRTVRVKTSISYTAPVKTLLREATIRQETYYECEPKEPQTLEAIREDFHLLEDLLLMLSDVDVALPWPTVRFGNEAGIYYFERRRTEPQKVEITKSWAALAWLSKSFGTLLTNLQTKQDELGPGLYLYLGIQRGTGLYLENKFSTAIFGLESLHRKTSTSPTQTKLQAKIDRILDDVQLAKDKEWLSGRLRNAGEPNLEERLFFTFSELDIGLDPKTLRAFSKECADIRNQVAHFGGQRQGDYSAFVQRMYDLNEVVRPLYHAVLLLRIGLDPDGIRRYFHMSPYSLQRKRRMKHVGLDFVAPANPGAPAAPTEAAASETPLAP